MAQLMPLPLTVSCFSKIQIGLPFWYRLTRVVPEKGPLNRCVCVCVLLWASDSWSNPVNCSQVFQAVIPVSHCSREGVLADANLRKSAAGFIHSWSTNWQPVCWRCDASTLFLSPFVMIAVMSRYVMLCIIHNITWHYKTQCMVWCNLPMAHTICSAVLGTR